MITTLQWPSKLAAEPAPAPSSRNTAADARRTTVILEGYGFDAWGFVILSPVVLSPRPAVKFAFPSPSSNPRRGVSFARAAAPPGRWVRHHQHAPGCLRIAALP